MDIKMFVAFKDKIVENVSRVIVGKNDVIELVIIAFICGGHILLEDVPGVGKTMLIKAFAKTIGCDFKRIQFTPDLLPSDLTGINFYNQKTAEFEFRSGPLFSNIVLADEINRATPRTQSSLLEAMEEKQITVDGITRKLDEPFMVLATQNPVESYGTFPLPEAQLDRFFMRINMGYPARDEEIEIIERNKKTDLIDRLRCMVEQDEIDYIRETYKQVVITPEILGYLMAIIEATRNNERIRLGVSPRGTVALFRACQAKAALEGRDFIIPEDVKKMAPYVLNHRLVTRDRSNNIYDFTKMIINTVKTPLEEI